MSTFRLARLVLTAAVAMAFAASASSCSAVLTPCDDITDGEDDAKDDFVDGNWKLYSVNGTLFNGSYLLAGGAAGRLTAGELDLTTFKVEEGACHDPKKSSGEVIALYKVIKANGTGGNPIVKVGSFALVNTQTGGALTLRALGKEATGTAVLQEKVTLEPATITMVVPIPIIIAGVDTGENIEYTLVFRRAKFGN